MNQITSEHAADLISDEYKTSEGAVEAVEDETVEEYVEVREAPDEGDVLGYNSNAVDVSVDLGEAGTALADMVNRQIDSIDQNAAGFDSYDEMEDKVEEDMAANFGAAYGMHVANEAYGVVAEDGEPLTQDQMETVTDAVEQAYDALEEATQSDEEIIEVHDELGARYTQTSKTFEKPFVEAIGHQNSDRRTHLDVLEDFQDEFEEMMQ